MHFHTDIARGFSPKSDPGAGARVVIGLIAAGAALAFGVVVFGPYSDDVALQLAHGPVPRSIGAADAALAAAARPQHPDDRPSRLSSEEPLRADITAHVATLSRVQR